MINKGEYKILKSKFCGGERVFLLKENDYKTCPYESSIQEKVQISNICLNSQNEFEYLVQNCVSGDFIGWVPEGRLREFEWFVDMKLNRVDNYGRYLH